MLILFAVALILITVLNYGSNKLRNKPFDKKTQAILPAGSFILIASSMVYLIFIIYGRVQGPWTTRRACEWGGPGKSEYVLDWPIGVVGLILLYTAWFLININLSGSRYKSLKYIGIIVYPIIIALLYLASKVPVNFSVFQG